MTQPNAHIGEKWLEYVYGELTQSEKSEFDHHIASCAECRNLVHSMQVTRSSLANLKSVEPSDRGIESLLEFAKKSTQKAGEKKSFLSAFTIPIFLSAASALVFGGLFLVGSQSKRPIASTNEAAVSLKPPAAEAAKNPAAPEEELAINRKVADEAKRAVDAPAVTGAGTRGKLKESEGHTVVMRDDFRLKAKMEKKEAIAVAEPPAPKSIGIGETADKSGGAPAKAKPIEYRSGDDVALEVVASSTLAKKTRAEVAREQAPAAPASRNVAQGAFADAESHEKQIAVSQTKADKDTRPDDFKNLLTEAAKCNPPAGTEKFSLKMFFDAKGALKNIVGASDGIQSNTQQCLSDALRVNRVLFRTLASQEHNIVFPVTP